MHITTRWAGRKLIKAVPEKENINTCRVTGIFYRILSFKRISMFLFFSIKRGSLLWVSASFLFSTVIVSQESKSSHHVQQESLYLDTSDPRQVKWEQHLERIKKNVDDYIARYDERHPYPPFYKLHPFTTVALLVAAGGASAHFLSNFARYKNQWHAAWRWYKTRSIRSQIISFYKEAYEKHFMSHCLEYLEKVDGYLSLSNDQKDMVLSFLKRHGVSLLEKKKYAEKIRYSPFSYVEKIVLQGVFFRLSLLYKSSFSRYVLGRVITHTKEHNHNWLKKEMDDEVLQALGQDDEDIFPPLLKSTVWYAFPLLLVITIGSVNYYIYKALGRRERETYDTAMRDMAKVYEMYYTNHHYEPLFASLDKAAVSSVTASSRPDPTDT